MKQLFFLAAVIIAFTSCRHVNGSGNIITEKKQTGDFKGIEAGGAFEVELKTGPAASVEIECDDNLMKYVETRVNGDVLYINIKNHLSVSNGHFKAYIISPEINSVKSSGAANINAVNILKYTGKITLEASGAGNIKAEVEAPEIDVEASGAGNIELTGRTKNYTAHASGSGDIRTKNLQSENTNVEVSGAGTAHVHASVSLKADASGAGHIYYRGGGNVQKKTSGAGDIDPEE